MAHWHQSAFLFVHSDLPKEYTAWNLQKETLVRIWRKAKKLFYPQKVRFLSKVAKSGQIWISIRTGLAWEIWSPFVQCLYTSTIRKAVTVLAFYICRWLKGRKVMSISLFTYTSPVLALKINGRFRLITPEKNCIPQKDLIKKVLRPQNLGIQQCWLHLVKPKAEVLSIKSVYPILEQPLKAMAKII